jgi:hypothetical protein
LSFPKAVSHIQNAAGLGASHQTEWTGIVARMMHLFATSTPEQADVIPPVLFLVWGVAFVFAVT